MRPILAAALLLSVAAPACRAEAPTDLRVPTAAEMAFLAANCRDNKIVRAGSVVAYGESFGAPLLVSSDRGSVLVDGVQVVPRPLFDANFAAERIADDLHSLFFVSEDKKAASARVEERLSELKAARTIDDFKVWRRRGKVAAFLIQAGGGQARAYMDALPRPLALKNRFLVDELDHEYLARAEESGGKESAQAWLKARLDELRSAGTIDRLSWEPERESAKIRFKGESEAREYAFGADESPFGVAIARREKLQRGRTEKAFRSVVARLEAGGRLRYSPGP